METIIIFLMTAGIMGNVLAQNTVKEVEYAAYLNASKTLWKQAIDRRQKAYDSDQNPNKLYDLTLAQYGLLNATIIDQDKKLFEEYVDLTVESLEKLIKSDKQWAEPKAVLSSVYGLKMGFSPWKGVFLGSKSGSLIEQALKLNDNSPLVWKIEASSKLFTPSMFGGDEEAAVEAFRKAVSLFEAAPDHLANNWLYLDALAWLGQACEKTGKQEEAIATYEKAVAAEPEFKWVKYKLLPAAKAYNK